MTFNSGIISPNDNIKQSSYVLSKNTRMLLAGFIGVSLLAVGFLNMPQSIKTNSNSISARLERSCGCDTDCLCGTNCVCNRHNLK